jgi:hypothetical protein
MIRGWLLRRAVIGVVGVCLLVSGCGVGADSLRLYPVAGRITFAGKPLENGRILFRPTEGERRGFSTAIRDGAYQTELPVGKLAVEITATRVVPDQFDESNGSPQPVIEMYIPDRYNRKTELTIDVTVSSRNTMDFKLTP